MIDIDGYDFICTGCWTPLLRKNMKSWSAIFSKKHGHKCAKCGKKLDEWNVRRSHQLENQIHNWLADLWETLAESSGSQEKVRFLGKVDGDMIFGDTMNASCLLYDEAAMGNQFVIEKVYRHVVNYFDGKQLV